MYWESDLDNANKITDFSGSFASNIMHSFNW